MRYSSRSFIALSMMVVLPAVARNPALAKERVAASESDDAEPKATQEEDAAATEEAPPSDEEKPAPKAKRKPKRVAQEPRDESRDTRFGGPAQKDHRHQTGLSIMPGSGYRMIARYKEGHYCGDSSGADKSVCAHAVPFFLDIQLAFGVSTRIDIITDLRFGLQSDPAISGGHQFGLAPGLRFWLDQDVSLKFYTTLQFMYEYLNFNGVGPQNNDFGVRNANGLMYDPIRNVGFFVQFGESIGFVRWFDIALDVGLGVQVRFP